MKYMILNCRYLKDVYKNNVKSKDDVIIRFYERDVDSASSHAGFSHGRVRRYFFRIHAI